MSDEPYLDDEEGVEVIEVDELTALRARVAELEPENVKLYEDRERCGQIGLALTRKNTAAAEVLDLVREKFSGLKHDLETCMNRGAVEVSDELLERIDGVLARLRGGA